MRRLPTLLVEKQAAMRRRLSIGNGRTQRLPTAWERRRVREWIRDGMTVETAIRRSGFTRRMFRKYFAAEIVAGRKQRLNRLLDEFYALARQGFDFEMLRTFRQLMTPGGGIKRLIVILARYLRKQHAKLKKHPLASRRKLDLDRIFWEEVQKTLDEEFRIQLDPTLRPRQRIDLLLRNSKRRSRLLGLNRRPDERAEEAPLFPPEDKKDQKGEKSDSGAHSRTEKTVFSDT